MPVENSWFQALRMRLESLFPPAPPARPGGWAGAAMLAGLLALAVFLQLLRPAWSVSLNSLWAEDGPIFLQEALTQDFAHAVTSTYAGYLVVVPRLIGEGAALVPLADAPAAVSILSAGVVALSGLAVWWATAGLIGNPYLRATLAVLTVLVPVGGLESLDSAAYVPWYMLFASFWLLLWRPPRPHGAVLGALFVLATGLSTPGVWFFLPLAVLRALAIRGRSDAMIVGGYTLGALAQVPVLALNHEETVTPAWTSDIWSAYVQRVVDGGAFGQHLGGLAWVHLGWPFLFALLAAAAIAFALGLRNSGGGARLIALLAAPISLALFAVSAYQRAVGSQLLWPPDAYGGTAGRYVIVPALLLVSAGMVLLDDSLRRRQGRRRLSWLAPAAIAVLMLGVVTSFDQRDVPVRGEPPWEAALRSAASTCGLHGEESAAIQTSPPGFGMALPCDRISSFYDPAEARRIERAESEAEADAAR